jgi:hypothetical protein
VELTQYLRVSRKLLEDESYMYLRPIDCSVLIYSLFHVDKNTMVLRSNSLNQVASGTNCTIGQLHSSLKRLSEKGFYKCEKLNGTLSDWKFLRTDIFMFC